VGAYVAGKYGGLGLRPGRSTMAAGLLDEMARAWGGRRGEPARAVRLSLQTVFVASLGWDGPSAEAPTVFDFIINERWLPCFRSEVPMEGVALHMARLGLRWRGTGVDECRLDTQRAFERGALAGRKVRLIELLDVTPSLRLHGLGISSLDELHAGGGELLSAERIEVIYARPGWAWSDVDRAHVRRLLREVAGNDRAKDRLRELVAVPAAKIVDHGDDCAGPRAIRLLHFDHVELRVEVNAQISIGDCTRELDVLS